MAKSKIPTKAEQTKLTQSYARMKHSQMGAASLPTQQRLHKSFFTYHRKLQDKYPDVDMESAAFWNALERRADTWWKAKASKGTGVDW